ncbi:hypothetical protein OIU76_003271, partial [Salix suchowensis]
MKRVFRKIESNLRFTRCEIHIVSYLSSAFLFLDLFTIYD